MPAADLGDVALHYREHGAGPPCIGIMGFALDQRFWSAQIPSVTKTHRFITFDNRGIRRSTGGVSTSIDQMADDTVRLLDHLGIESCVVMGASMGGTIAQRLVLDHPDRVSALVLVVTWARPIEFMRRQHIGARVVIEHAGAEALSETALLWLFSPSFFEIGREQIDRLLEIVASEQQAADEIAQTLLGQLDALDKHDALAELGGVSCPTLVVGGLFDVMAPHFASEEIAAAIPGAELVSLPAGHGLMLEAAAPFNAALEAFLRRLV